VAIITSNGFFWGSRLHIAYSIAKLTDICRN